MSQIKSPVQESNDEIDLSQLIYTLWRGKWVVIITAFITGALGVAYAIMATPIYNGSALIQIEEKSGGFSGLTDLSDAFGGGTTTATETELEILRSRKVLMPTIDKYNLAIEAKPLTFPIVGDYFYRKYGKDNGFAEPLFNFLAGYSWGGEQIIVNLFDVPATLYKSSFEIIKLKGDKYSLNLDGVKIFEGLVGKPYNIKEWNIDIQLGRLAAREGTYFSLKRLDKTLIVDSLVRSIIISEKGKKSGIVNVSLQGADKQKIKQVIDHVLTTYQQQNIEYNSVEASNSLAFIEERLPLTRSKLTAAEEDIYQYRLNNKTVDLTLQTQQLLDQLLKIEEGINELKLQEPEIARKFKRQHPIYIEFFRKKADLENKRAKVSLQTAQIPTEQFNIFRLQRDVELSQKIFLQTLNKFEELKIIKAGTLGSIRIIDDTLVHPIAVEPRKMVVVIIAIIVGIILAMVFIIIRSMLFKGVETAEQLEDLGYNVYASIPLSPLEEKMAKLKPKIGETRVLSDMYPEELTVEALRSLRTSLHFAMMEAENNIILITGPSPNIGKSFISQNLATLIAQSGSKVLLVDMDLRRGRMHDSFGCTAMPGLSEYLAGAVELEDVVHSSKIKKLDIITRGKCPPNPSELLMGKSFKKFCNEQQKNYDFIILDTPPILAVTDASIAGKYAGTSMMVVKQAVNQIKEVEFATNKLAISGVTIKGYIFNGISKNTNSYKSQNSYYQYEYKKT